MVINECQWLGAAIDRASNDLSSSAFRTSEKPLAPSTLFSRFANTFLSGSIKATISTFACPFHPPIWAPPRPFKPATPILTRSLAPIMFPEAFVPEIKNELPATNTLDFFRKSRRELSVSGAVGFSIMIILKIGAVQLSKKMVCVLQPLS